MKRRGRIKSTESKKKASVSKLFNHEKLSSSKANLGKSALNTLVDIGVGLLGGLGGAALGTYSLPVGAALTGAGYYFDNTLVSRFGYGMALSTVVGSLASLQGTQPARAGLEGVVDDTVFRMQKFANSMESKTGIDKLKSYLSKDKAVTIEGTAGFGQIYTELPLSGFGSVEQTDAQAQQQALDEYVSSFEAKTAQPQAEIIGKRFL